MKKCFSLAMIALFATVSLSIAGADKEAVLAREKAAWEAFKEKKPDDFKKVVHADFRGVFAEGATTLQAELADMQKWDMKSFAISDFEVTAPDANTLVTTYKVAIEGVNDGKDKSGTYNAGSVWVKVKGDWQAIFHTNTKAAPAAK